MLVCERTTCQCRLAAVGLYEWPHGQECNVARAFHSAWTISPARSSNLHWLAYSCATSATGCKALAKSVCCLLPYM